MKYFSGCVLPQEEARKVSSKYCCAECGGAILMESHGLKEDGKPSFDNLKVFCQLHPTGSIITKWEWKRRRREMYG